MSAAIYLAPTAGGKTAWVVDAVRRAATGLRRTPLIVVATPLQAVALRRRLARAGGALGVRIQTFDDLYTLLLQQARVTFTEVDEPVRYRLLRTALDDLHAAGELNFYRNLVARPGFIAAMEALIGQLKGAGIRPAQLQAALAEQSAAPRLLELGAIYTRYQALLDANNWTDRPGVAALALAALQGPTLPPAWGPVFFDGFDSFTVVQRAVIRALAQQLDQVVVLLTGTADKSEPSPYALFEETAAILARELEVPLSPLPQGTAAAPEHSLRPLADSLFRPQRLAAASVAPVTLLAAADRGGEVRAALRWLKQRIVVDGLPPGELVLLARSVEAYRDLVGQIAAEFGLPVYTGGHLPLAANPAISSLLNLLHLFLPIPEQSQPVLLRRGVVEAWRSPYFDWAAGEGSPGISAGDAELLDALARRFVVIRGLDQWREAFALAEAAAPAEASAPSDSDEEATAGAVPVCRRLCAQFERFVACLAPPPEAARLHDFVSWLEDLVGADPLQNPQAEPEAPGAPPAGGPVTLDMVACIRRGEANLQARDIAALRRFKDVLRGLVWAEEAVGQAQGRTRRDAFVDYRGFLAELVGAIAAAGYEPMGDRGSAILFTELHDARGVSFAAAAILGMAEGELPRRRSEDPFLRNADRRRLRSQGLPLEDSTRSFEREAFYTSVARGRNQLLLCRPRMAENGAPWEPSPYWEEVTRLLHSEETLVPGEYRPPLAEAASLPEAVESSLRHPAAAAWVATYRPEVSAAVGHAAMLLAARTAHRGRTEPSIFDGFFGHDLAAREQATVRLRRWSPSGLERYRACPYWFYLAHVLQLEARAEPEEGANVAQAGNVYHRIFEQVYQAAADPTNLDALLAALPGVAKAVLDAAPREEGFRVTAWWLQTRREIEEQVAASLAALAEYDGTPIAFEQRFGRELPLTIAAGDDAFVVSGVIDRIDRRPDGTLRIVDYKTGVSDYNSAKALVQGKRLQLALYALAAEEALRLGKVSDGFYWFAHKATSSWTLAEFADGDTGAHGPAGAIELARRHAIEAVAGARRGEFAPQTPAGGCPDYCTAATFCWRFRPKFTG
jgi:ATP-dependent helicase/DNAse subunit B